MRHVRGSNLVSVTVLKIFRNKELWPWSLTSQGHPKWIPWALYIISVGSNIVTLAVLDIFTSKSMTLIFDPSVSSKVKSDGANQKPIGTFVYDFCWVQHRISHRFVKNHPPDQPTAHPPNQRLNVCRSGSRMQYLQPGP